MTTRASLKKYENEKATKRAKAVKHEAEVLRGLSAALQNAMAKAGVDAKIWLDPHGLYQSDWRDYTGIGVHAETVAIANRAADWIVKYLEARGVVGWDDDGNEARPFAQHASEPAAWLVEYWKKSNSVHFPKAVVALRSHKIGD